jgi:tetratricopeptide (TPR) repeat protein
MRHLLPLLLLLGCTTSEREKPKKNEAPAAPSLSALRYQPKPEEKEIATAQALLTKAPDRIDGWESLAIALIRESRKTSDPEYNVLASELIEQGKNRFPRDPRLEILHLMMLLDEHRFREAKQIGTALVERHPDNVTGWILTGDAMLELGQYSDAVGAYQRAMDLRPDLRSYNRAAHLRWLHGNFDGAIEMLESALDAGSSRDPEPRAWCYVDLAHMFYHRGDAPRAAKSLELAFALVPDYTAALSLRARVSILEGDRNAAIATLEKAIAKRADTSDLLLLSDLLQESGKQDEAARYMERANKLGEHDPRPLAHYLARKNLDPERALTLAKRAHEDRPTIEADDTLALAALRAKKIDDAEQAIERATKLGTLDANLWLHRAMIEAATDVTAAKKSLAHALELNPKVDPLLLSEARRAIPE